MEELLQECEGLISAIASKFYNVDKEDLMQAGRTGLINAYNHYDKKSNTKFSTFAYSYIFGEMYNLAISSKSFKTNRDNLKLIKLIERAKIYLTQSLNKEPSIKDISTYLNIDEDIISNVYYLNEPVVSLDNTLYDQVSFTLDNDNTIDLQNGINQLKKEEQDIIKYRYYNDYTQSQTAKILNMSQVKVSRYEQKSLKKLKKIITC